MSKKQLENLLTHLPQQALTYFASPKPSPPILPSLRPPGLLCKPASQSSASPGNPVHLPQCPLLSMPSSQVWDTAPRRPQQGTKRLRARFGLISGIGPAGLNQDLALNLFQEILLKFPPILPTQCSHGKKVCAYRCIVSVPGKDFTVCLKTKLFPNDNAKVAHQSKLFPAVI